jgi:hypothetical protein
MSEQTAEQTAEATEASEQASTEATTEQAAEKSEKVDGEDALGDKGRSALESMKAELRAARAEVSELRAVAGDKRGLDRIRQERAELEELRQFRAKAEGREAEYEEAKKQRESEQAALAKANDRIRRSEVKAAAKGVLADPADAYKFLDLDSFEVDDDGNVDEKAIADALADLVQNKPYLAVQDSKRFQGDADAGARKEARPSQLTRSDLDRMSPEQINEARQKGQLDDLLGIKR